MSRKRLLFARCFGIGNALMSVPAIRCYARNGYDVDVLVGTTPDDGGAYEVLSLVQSWPRSPPSWASSSDGEVRVRRDSEIDLRVDRWDVGVFSIPYDGRWAALEPLCDFVYDGRSRPDPTTFGLGSWQKHEAEYQQELAEEICGIPPAHAELCRTSRLRPDIGHPAIHVPGCPHTVYIGVGRKRDRDGFWERKHWGDENFCTLVRMILDRTDCDVIGTGNRADLVTTGAFMRKRVGDPRRVVVHDDGSCLSESRFSFSETSIKTTLDVLTRCDSFIGNDTGTMHMAAACGLPIVSVFKMDGALRKNHPLSDPETWRVLEGHSREVTPEEVYNAWMQVNGL